MNRSNPIPQKLENPAYPTRQCIAVFVASLTCLASPAGAITTNDFGAQHSLKLLTQHSYLPGIPVLVRVELRNASGPERELWNAEAILNADDPAVTLSTSAMTWLLESHQVTELTPGVVGSIAYQGIIVAFASYLRPGSGSSRPIR